MEEITENSGLDPIDRPIEIPLLGLNLPAIIPFSYLSMVMFFLLSGYQLTWTEEGRERRGAYSALNYGKRRALRIVPAYYVAIALVVLLWESTPSFGTVVIHLTFLHGLEIPYPRGLDPVFWSLSVEAIFYASLPLLVLKFRRLSQRLIILGVLAAISLATRLFMGGYLALPALEEFVSKKALLQFFPTTLLYLFIVGMLLKMMVNASIRATNLVSGNSLRL